LRKKKQRKNKHVKTKKKGDIEKKMKKKQRKNKHVKTKKKGDIEKKMWGKIKRKRKQNMGKVTAFSLRILEYYLI